MSFLIYLFIYLFIYSYSLKSIKSTQVIRLNIRLKSTTLPKVTLLHGYFSRFLNCANGTKSRKASPLLYFQLDVNTNDNNYVIITGLICNRFSMRMFTVESPTLLV